MNKELILGGVLGMLIFGSLWIFSPLKWAGGFSLLSLIAFVCGFFAPSKK